jgi:hypothetical protein
MGETGFSEDYLNKMTDKLANIASAVTGTAASSKGFGAGSTNFGSLGVVNMLTCQPGTECYKTKQTKWLNDQWQGKKKIYADAPLDLSHAEKNYYEFNKGESGGREIYNRLIVDRFAKTAEEFKKNSIDMQQQFMADLTQTLKQYQAEVIFQVQTEKLLKTRREEQNVLKKNINYFQKIVQTSERKVVYQHKNMSTLLTYRRIMFFIYYGAIIFFIVFGNFITERLYLKGIVWLLLVIASIFPLLLNILIIWAFVIWDTLVYWYSDPHYGYGRFQRYKDVYYDMDNPFDEAPPQPPIKISNSTELPAALTAALSPLSSLISE